MTTRTLIDSSRNPRTVVVYLRLEVLESSKDDFLDEIVDHAYVYSMEVGEPPEDDPGYEFELDNNHEEE